MNNSLRDPFNLRRNLLVNGNGRAPAAQTAFTQLNLLRETASHVATQVTERVAETAAEAIERGKQAVEDLNQNLREQRERAREKKDDDYSPDYESIDEDGDETEGKDEEDMSFTIPKNVPSFTNPQRAVEDRLWSSSGVTARGGRGAAGAGSGIIGDSLDKVGGLLNPNRETLPMYKDKPYAYPPNTRTRPFYRRKSCMAWALFLVLAVAYWLGLFSKGGYEKIPSLRTSDWLNAEKNVPAAKADWQERRERVVEAFELSWDAYERYAWGRFPMPLGQTSRLREFAADIRLLQVMMSTTQSQGEDDIWPRKASAGSLSMRSIP